MPKQVVRTTGASKPLSPVSQATRAGGFIFTRGILGRDQAGVLADGMAAQARQALETLKAILASAGAGLEDVVRMEVMVAEMAELPAFNAVFREYFPVDPPARSGVQVAGISDGGRVMITAVAYTG